MAAVKKRKQKLLMKILHFKADKMKSILFVCIKGAAVCIVFNESMLKEMSRNKASITTETHTGPVRNVQNMGHSA
jgi:hypothetical protein